jgi:hypothetical protein
MCSVHCIQSHPLYCPSTTPFSEAQALTIYKLSLPNLRSCERRNLLPSMGMTWLSVTWCIAWIYCMKQLWSLMACLRYFLEERRACSQVPGLTADGARRLIQ